jgi:hypothetical protein
MVHEMLVDDTMVHYEMLLVADTLHREVVADDTLVVVLMMHHFHS